VVIRPATPADAEAIWHIFEQVVARRDTYAFAPDTPREVGVGYWFGPDVTSFVAELDDQVLGVYKLMENRRDLGGHVANASFMVAPEAAGRGLGRAMGRHSLQQARIQGYDAMQFNFVVSTNRRAVALWQSLGFQIVGRLPRAFQHGTLGMVDAFVMHRFLDDIVPRFGGERIGTEVTVRRCAYAVLPAGRSHDGPRPPIAVVRTSGGVMLPGGAIEAEEDASATVIREVAEECALRATIRQLLGDAVQIVGGVDNRPVVEKRSQFFSVDVHEPLGERPEHEVAWLSASDALGEITNDSHQWAIRRWLRSNI
jgi:L-amino acid N-acyltransferase YncA/8-oxo-dGTP pyrophosphatase MutT (NUDIX family)